MAKYSKDIVNNICSLIRADSYTIPEICQRVGIAESTYHQWRATKSEFSEAIKKAQNEFIATMASEAKKSLMKKVRGYEVEEIKTVYQDSGEKNDEREFVPKIKEQTKTTKHIQPDTTAIIFTLVNLEPETWKNRQPPEIAGNATLSKPLSAEERRKIEDDLNNQY